MVREIFFSMYYGTSNISDAFIVSFIIPGIIFSFLGSGIASSYIPIYNEIRYKKSNEDAEAYTMNLVSVLFLFATIMLVIINIFLREIIMILAHGFNEETILLTIKFTRIMLTSLYFSILINIFIGYLNIHKNFFKPNIIGLVSNISIMVFIYLSDMKKEILLLPLGVIIGLVLQVFLLIFELRKHKFSFKFRFDIKDENIKEMVKIAIPIILGLAISEINTIIDKTMASGISEGGISALNYASKLNLLLLGVFVTSIMTVMYPAMAKKASENKLDELYFIFKKIHTFIIIAVVPVILFTVIFSKEIVTIIYGRGNFDKHSIQMTSGVFFYYSFGILGLSLRELYTKTLYSLKDTKSTMIATTSSVSINILLNIILGKIMGLNGLALSTSIASYFGIMILKKRLRKKIEIDNKKDKDEIKQLFQTVVATITFGITIVILKISIKMNSINILFVFIVAITIYILVLFLLKNQIICDYIYKIKGKLKNKGEKYV